MMEIKENNNRSFCSETDNFYKDENFFYISFPFEYKNKKVFYNYTLTRLKLILSSSFCEQKMNWFEGKNIKSDNLEFLLFCSDESKPC